MRNDWVCGSKVKNSNRSIQYLGITEVAFEGILVYIVCKDKINVKIQLPYVAVYSTCFLIKVCHS